MRTLLVAALVASAFLIAESAGAAGEIPRRPAHPRSGGPHTTFVLRYTSEGADIDGGDQVYLYGPPRTGCRGLLAREPAGDGPGPEAVPFGFKSSMVEPQPGYDTESQHRPHKLRHWCRGYYHGAVIYESRCPGCTATVLRFFFIVR